MRDCFQPQSVDVQQIKDPINNRRDHTVSEIHGNQRGSAKEDTKSEKHLEKLTGISHSDWLDVIKAFFYW